MQHVLLEDHHPQDRQKLQNVQEIAFLLHITLLFSGNLLLSRQHHREFVHIILLRKEYRRKYKLRTCPQSLHYQPRLWLSKHFPMISCQTPPGQCAASIQRKLILSGILGCMHLKVSVNQYGRQFFGHTLTTTVAFFFKTAFKIHFWYFCPKICFLCPFNTLNVKNFSQFTRFFLGVNLVGQK